VVDRQLKKVAKADEFKTQVWHGIDFISEHPAEIRKYGAIALGVVVLAVGTYFFIRHQAEVREEALSQALKVDDATVGANPQPAPFHFNTQDEKDQATNKAYAEVAAKYHGSQEGAIAGMNLAQAAVDKGDMAGAEKQLKDLMSSAPPAYASQAALTLADIYRVQEKYADAEKILNDLVKNPTVTVSKEEAQLALAKVKLKTDPAAARKILEDLRTSRTAISKAAMTAMGELASAGQ
jgi:predicted negative regulator of RcsB-dependent stress response